MAPATPPPRAAKASVAQVAATIFFALIAIGKRNTWEKNGVTVTPLQVAAGALVGLIVVLAGLVSLALLASR